jgi:hypothetical protein
VSTSRRWPRVDVVLDVTVRFENPDDVVEARTLNVSREGVFIAMDAPVALGARVRLRVDIAQTGESYGAEGLVVRRQPDPDDPSAPSYPRGIALFLTATGPGWVRWCDELIARGGSR